MDKMLTVFVTALLVVVGCDGVSAPAQYDHAMLRNYFGQSRAEVKDTFGKPSSITHANSQLPLENPTAKEQEKFSRATASMSHI